MKNLFTLILVAVAASLWAQPTYSSEFIDEPESLVDFVIDCAEFWSGVEDEEYGGYFTRIGRQGNVLGNNYPKGIVSQSRDAYGLTRAFMLTGNEAYLTKARIALDFMYNYLWDDQFGGWYIQTSRTGSSPTLGTKTAFDQHYGLLGIMASFEATGDSADWEMLMNGYDFIEDKIWDDDAENFGYFHAVDRDGSSPVDKSFNSTVDAVTTHLYSLYLLTGDVVYYNRLLQMKRNMIDHLIGSMPDQAIGFAEHYHSDWTVDESDDRTIMGHVLKTSWCLARIYRMEAEQESLDGSKLLTQEILDKAYDYEYGGPYKDYIRTSGQMLMYGAIDTAKAWWQMEQAVMAGFLLFEITWDPIYLQMADESLNFFMKYFVDPVYDEIYADRAREGGRVYYGGGYWDENKGSDWKAAYHSIETGYYSYIYSKLLIKQEPVTLYYKYSAEEGDRTLSYNPVALDFDKLSIISVSLNGEEYTDFDGNARTVTIPAETAGVFAVTYSMENPGPVVPTFVPTSIKNNTLNVSIYPNPASDWLTINLPEAQKTTISIWDKAGRLIKTDVVNQTRSRLDVRDLSPGAYTVQFENKSESAAKVLIIVHP